MTGEYIAATRASYDAVAAAYADQLSDELRRKPLDRALLTAFAEQVRAATPAQPPTADPGHAPTADPARPRARASDVGCGPGHVTAFLAGLGPGRGRDRPVRPRWSRRPGPANHGPGTFGCGLGHVTALPAPGWRLDAAGIDLSGRPDGRAGPGPATRSWSSAPPR